MFQGAMTAMITPFRAGQVDYERLTLQARHQIDQGIDGLVPVGTTGESPTLSHEEHRQVIEHVVNIAAAHGRRVPVIAGTGSNSTAEAMDLTAHAASVGADGALMVNPYYNKPTQEGLYRHFMTIAEAVDIPIILYNIPGRTGITMTPQTVARLARNARIVAVKEATGSLDIASEIASLCNITILSGDDSLTLPLMSIGGKGVISVLSNLIPARIKQFVAAAQAGEWAAARKQHLELFPLFKGMFVETNPIPIKAAMAMVGRDSGELRLPMCELSEPHRAGLKKLLENHGLL